MTSERFKKGYERLNEIRDGGADKVLEGLGNIAPDMANYVLEFIFSDLYGRGNLDLKTKQMITITALAVIGNAKPQLIYHIENGLNLGLTQAEIIDIMTHLSGYAGFPAALNGIAAAREAFSKIEEKV